MITPCKGCQERTVGCHGKCAEYATYREELAEANHKKRMIQIVDGAEAMAKARTARRYQWNHMRRT